MTRSLTAQRFEGVPELEAAVNDAARDHLTDRPE
jgi:hypothetical protein